MVLADRGTGLMQEIVSGIRDSGVNPLNFSFRLFPVIAELLLATHAALIMRQSLLMFFETIQWCNIVAVTQRRESSNPDIDTNCRCGDW